MPSVVDVFFGWTHKPARIFSAFRSGLAPSTPATPVDDTGETLIYRLRYWPQIPSLSKTADIYRTLSVMSNRPVNRRWILNNSSLDARAVDHLLRRLVEQDAVEVIDARRYRPDPNAA
jgi:hypothetical protein